MEVCQSTDAYFMRDPSEEFDQRSPLRLSDVNVSLNDLEEVGVLSYTVNMGGDWQSAVEDYSQQVGMKNRDVCTINRTAMPDFEKKLSIFFEEHLHTDPEVRFIMDGSGYFDVRDKKDRWIRIPVRKGDLLFLPAGIYHRFTTDANDTIVAMRFFKDAPCWTPLNRSDPETDANPVRENYVNAIAQDAADGILA